MMQRRAQIEIDDADGLRSLLDDLNEAGALDRVAGVDAAGTPFLAFLAGIYADSAWVYSYNPRDPEIEPWQGQAKCPECGCVDPFKLTDLVYPVTVIR